jgi:hypothetical protein
MFFSQKEAEIKKFLKYEKLLKIIRRSGIFFFFQLFKFLLENSFHFIFFIKPNNRKE